MYLTWRNIISIDIVKYHTLLSLLVLLLFVEAANERFTICFHEFQSNISKSWLEFESYFISLNLNLQVRVSRVIEVKKVKVYKDSLQFTITATTLMSLAKSFSLNLYCRVVVVVFGGGDVFCLCCSSHKSTIKSDLLALMSITCSNRRLLVLIVNYSR